MIKKGWKVKALVVVLMCVFTITLLSGGLCFAQEEKYPAKPIILVVPWGVGGGSDVMARTLAAIAPEYLGVPLVVKLRPGAAGTIGAYEVANTKPDGYTLIINGQSETITVPHSREVPYDPIEDFEFICQMGESPQGLYVWTGHPWKSVDEVVEYAKKNPGKLKIGHSGTGGLEHTQVLQFEQAAGIDLEDIPFQGGGPAGVAAAGGHIDATMGSLPAKRAHVEAGNLRLLAFSSLERNPLNPDVPTFKELGYDVVMTNRVCISAPKGTPQDRINYLADAFYKTYENPSWIGLTKKLLIARSWIGPDKVKEVVKEQYETAGRLLEEHLR